METKYTLYMYFNDGDSDNARVKVTISASDYDDFVEYMFDGDGPKGFYSFDEHKMYVNCAQITHILVTEKSC